MAMINEVSFTKVIDDIRYAHLNAFTAIGDTWYFAYVNLAGHAMLTASDDEGLTWSTVGDFGEARWITCTTAGSDVAVGVTSPTVDTTTIYVGGAVVASASGSSSGGCVYVEPYVVMIALPGVESGGLIANPSAGSWGDDPTTFVSTPPIYAIVGTGSGAHELNFVCAGSLDSGAWSGTQAAVASDFFVAPSDSSPGSPNVLHYTLQSRGSATSAGAWPGLASRTLSGYINGRNFSGTGTGGAPGLAFDRSAQATRGTYFTGYDLGASTLTADRGLIGPSQTAFSADIDEMTVCFFVDRNGLYGSTIATGLGGASDSAGITSPFGKAKIYGNNPITIGRYCYGPNDQSAALTTLLLETGNSAQNAGQGMTLYRFRDPAVASRPHAMNTQLLSSVAVVDKIIGPSDPLAQTMSGNALGVARDAPAEPSYGVPLLIASCADTGLLANPNRSPGCSPILRQIMTESGVPYSVVRELSNDADPNGHLGGNALDLTGPSTPTLLNATTLSAAANQEMAEICGFLRSVPQLFASALHYDPIIPRNSLYIWDGHLVTADQFGGTASRVVQDAIGNIHLSSSKARLLAALRSPVIAAALGTGPAYVDPSGEITTVAEVPDQFSSDRYVYVNTDGYVGGTVQGLAVRAQAPMPINFW